MKKLFKVTLIAACILSISSFAKAQTKVGYVNFNLVVTQMPEYKTIRSQIDIYQKQFVDQLTAMNNELQTKGKEFQTKGATMTDAVRSAKQTELQDFQKRLQDYEANAQQQVDAKSNELSKPLIDKARVAVQEVAKEKGYSYVLDSSQIQMLVSPEGDDMMASVKVKLGLK